MSARPRKFICLLERTSSQEATVFDCAESNCGNGVTIFLGGTGGISIGSANTISLKATKSGTYAGILFFQSRTNPTLADFSKQVTLNTGGAFYFPDASISLGKQGANLTCAEFVAQSITTLQAVSWTLNNTCSDFGGSPLHTMTLAE